MIDDNDNDDDNLGVVGAPSVFPTETASCNDPEDDPWPSHASAMLEVCTPQHLERDNKSSLQPFHRH